VDITNVAAVITGATGGIGKATAVAFLEAGAGAVGLLARNTERLGALTEELTGAGYGERIVPLLADLQDHTALDVAFADFVARTGRIDVLVNNAAVMLDGAMYFPSQGDDEFYPMESWNTTLASNLTGPFRCAQLAVKHMAEAKTQGVIVNLTSISRHGQAGQAAYSTTKGGIVSLTLSLAQELAPMHIRCVAVSPGLVETKMSASIPPVHRKRLLKKVPVGRMATPEEVAHAIRFCVENDYFNGAVLDLDGGMKE